MLCQHASSNTKPQFAAEIFRVIRPAKLLQDSGSIRIISLTVFNLLHKRVQRPLREGAREKRPLPQRIEAGKRYPENYRPSRSVASSQLIDIASMLVKPTASLTGSCRTPWGLHPKHPCGPAGGVRAPAAAPPHERQKTSRADQGPVLGSFIGNPWLSARNNPPWHFLRNPKSLGAGTANRQGGLSELGRSLAFPHCESYAAKARRQGLFV